MFIEQQHEISTSNPEISTSDPTFDSYVFITETSAVSLYTVHRLHGTTAVLRLFSLQPPGDGK